MSTFTALILHSTGSSCRGPQTRERGEKNQSRKGESKTVIICRRHDSVNRKPYSLHQKTTRPNKWIWQNSRIQSQYSEIDNVFVNQQWNIKKRNWGGGNTVYYNNKKNKVPRNKFNWGDKRPVLGKLQNTEQRNQGRYK